MVKASKCAASGSGKDSIPPTSKRFNLDLEDDFEDMCLGFVPKNTVADTEKCVRLFQSWVQARHMRFPRDKVPADILLMDDHPLLAKWFCRFRTKVCKINGEQYPPKTPQHYLMGIQWHIWNWKENQINLMMDINIQDLLDN